MDFDSNQYSRLSAIEVNGRSVGADNISGESGKTVFGRFLSLLKGAAKELRFMYHRRYAAATAFQLAGGGEARLVDARWQASGGRSRVAD
jgi:hypothetical protein